MKIAMDPFWDENQLLFECFDQAYLFGSAIYKKHPEDIDLILIYNDKYRSELNHACGAIRKSVFNYFGCEAHLTILSISETAEAQIFKQINVLQLK